MVTKEQQNKRWNREVPNRQVFCTSCGGLKNFYVRGQAVKPENWIHYGMASDIGCFCRAGK